MQTPGTVDVRGPPVHEGNTFPAGPNNEPNFQKLSRQEQQILAECRSESYWFRSLPLSLALGSAAFYAVKQGIVLGSQRFGPWPKTVIGAAAGYIVGKISYTTTCQEKFVREAPDSNIGRSIRMARGENVPDREPEVNRSPLHEEGLFPDGKDIVNTQGDTAYSDYFASPEVDKSIDRSRPTGALTYDQLRAQHRQKEMEKPYMQQGALIKPSTPIDPNKASAPPASYSPQPSSAPEMSNVYLEIDDEASKLNSPSTRKGTNKYGDEGFE